jgi:hypothetical protein
MLHIRAYIAPSREYTILVLISMDKYIVERSLTRAVGSGHADSQTLHEPR